MAVLAVLVGHAAVVLLVWQARRQPADRGEVRDAILLRLVPPAPAPVQRQRTARVQARLPAGAPVVLRLIAPPELAAAPGADGPRPGGGSEAPASPGVPASGVGALNLKPSAAVLRGELANPATADPRSNSPKPTLEERVAMGLDPDLCVKLERDPDGRVRRRMGRLVSAQSLLQSTHGVGAMRVKVCE